jgi:hypothetical protein
VEPSYDDALAWLRGLSIKAIQEIAGCGKSMAIYIRSGARQPSRAALAQIADDYAEQIAAFVELLSADSKLS